MNSYTKFAHLYDGLMNQDVNYDHWADYIENMFDHYGVNPEIVCDLACGTGNMTIPLALRGYDMIGVDRSFDMLSIARSKAKKKNADVMFLEQNLTELDLYGSCGAFLCMIDGFNYILNPNSLYKIAKRIKTCFLDTDGIFMFDISSEHKLANFIGNNTFIHDGDEVFYTWENKYKKPFCKMELNFFKKGESGFDRFEEVQIQRAYSEKEIKDALVASGFSVVDVYGGYDFSPAKEDSQRLVFVAKPEL